MGEATITTEDSAEATTEVSDRGYDQGFYRGGGYAPGRPDAATPPAAEQAAAPRAA